MERKMKDSGIPWIGMIPEDWERINLKQALKFQKGTIPSKYSDVPLKYPYLSMDYLRDRNDKQVLYPIPNSSMLLMDEGELIVLWDGANAGEFIKSKQGYLGSTMAKAIIPRNKINENYLYYFLKALEPVSKDFANGTTIPHFTPVFLYSFWYHFPLLSEQEAIASWLDEKCGEIDELIDIEQQMIDELEAYRQATITETVTGSTGILPVYDENGNCTRWKLVLHDMRQTGISWIPEIPEHWEICRLKDKLCCSLQYGANESGEQYKEDLPRYIRITDISLDGKLKDDDKKSLSAKLSIPYLLNEGDILFARSGATVGKAFIYREEYGPAAYAGYLIRAKVDSTLLPLYLFYYTQTSAYEQWKNGIFIQATIQNIGADKYSYLPICIPSLSEQRAIADYLDTKCKEIDELIAVKRDKIETLKQYRQSIIFEAVTGKIQVAHASSVDYYNNL